MVSKVYASPRKRTLLPIEQLQLIKIYVQRKQDLIAVDTGRAPEDEIERTSPL